MRRALLIVCWVAACWAAVSPAQAASRYDPRLRFRTLRTEHFTIHYHQGTEAHARRLADLAEQVRTDLEQRLNIPAPGHAHVVLVDQADIANGWSTPLPYNLIEIALTPPAPDSFLGHHDDWLRLVFTHEYTHTMHLDLVDGWMRVFRTVLGRHPLAFPNLFVPAWQVEGLATYAESAAGRGRVHAADVRSVLRAQNRAGRTPHLDQLAGGLVAWPSGSAPYFYGGLFYDYLVRVGGQDAPGTLARETARRLPTLGAGAFKKVFGSNASATWKAFRTNVLASGSPVEPEPTASVRLTHSGFVSSSPRFSRDTGASSNTNRVFYSSNTAHRFPSLRSVHTDGTGDTRIRDRYLGNTIGFWREWTIYDQLEFDGPVALFSDLWATHVPSGRTVRLTRGARIGDPDVSADGRFVAAVATSDGRRRLVVLPVSQDAGGQPRVEGAPTFNLDRAGCSFATPRWSPDGRRLAAVMHCLGELPAVVLVDVETGTLARVAPQATARDITPAWTPDGRWILFASDRTGGQYRIYAALAEDPAGPPADVLAAPGGATAPDVSADGVSLVYLSATADGQEVFLHALPRFSAPAAAGADIQAEAAAPAAGAGAGSAAGDRGYSPWGSMLPRAWQPWAVIDGERVDLGAAISGTDPLGRHTYVALATWPASRPSPSAGFPTSTRLDWSVSYTYDRWRPAFFITASDQTDPISVTFSGTPAVFTANSRAREVFGGLIIPVRRVRASQAFLAGASLHDERIALPSQDFRRAHTALRAAWAFSSAREYGYSISLEDGVRAGATVEHRRPSTGADGPATTMTADARLYLPGGWTHAVLAVRAAAGLSVGDRTMRRVFAAGGNAAWPSTWSFDRRAVALLRGIDADTPGHTAIVNASADYRFRVATVERGLGTWPLFVNQLYGAVFADYGALGADMQTLDRKMWSAGGELSASITVGHSFPLTLTAGAAWTHDDARTALGGQASFYVRTGYAF
jgi:hypothetical protein